MVATVPVKRREARRRKRARTGAAESWVWGDPNGPRQSAKAGWLCQRPLTTRLGAASAAER